MDESNKKLISKVVNDKDQKIEMLNGYIEDPWYTRRFDKVFEQIYEGCERVLKELEK